MGCRKSASVVYLVMVALGWCAGCSSSPSPQEAIVEEMIGSLREVSSALGNATDNASTERATTVVDRETTHLNELRKRLALLAPLHPSPKIKKRSEEVANESKAVKRNMAAARERMQKGKISEAQGQKLTLAVNIYGASQIDFANAAAPLYE